MKLSVINELKADHLTTWIDLKETQCAHLSHCVSFKSFHFVWTRLLHVVHWPAFNPTEHLSNTLIRYQSSVVIKALSWTQKEPKAAEGWYNVEEVVIRSRLWMFITFFEQPQFRLTYQLLLPLLGLGGTGTLWDIKGGTWLHTMSKLAEMG